MYQLFTDLSRSNYQKHKRKLNILEEGITPSKIRRVTDSIQHHGATNGVNVSMFVNGTPQGHPAYGNNLTCPHTVYTTLPQKYTDVLVLYIILSVNIITIGLSIIDDMLVN